MTSPSFEEVGPADVFEAASYGERGVGARFRPAASRRFESVAEDVLAGAFHDAGSSRQSMLPVEVALHSVRVGLAVANAGRNSFGPVAMRLRNGHRLSGPPAVRESSETALGSTHAEPPQSRLQPSNTESGRNAKTQNRLKPKKMGCTRVGRNVLRGPDARPPSGRQRLQIRIHRPHHPLQCARRGDAPPIPA